MVAGFQSKPPEVNQTDFNLDSDERLKTLRASIVQIWARKQPPGNLMSYHIRNVPVLSTIEMSPGCGFTLPRKSGRVPLRKSLFSRDDSELEEGFGLMSGVGARGKGQRPFPPSALY